MHHQSISRVALLASKGLYKHMCTDWTLRIIFLYGHIWTDKAPREKKKASLEMKIKIPCRAVLLCSLGFLYLALKSQNAAKESTHICPVSVCYAEEISVHDLMAGGGDTNTMPLGRCFSSFVSNDPELPADSTLESAHQEPSLGRAHCLLSTLCVVTYIRWYRHSQKHAVLFLSFCL